MERSRALCDETTHLMMRLGSLMYVVRTDANSWILCKLRHSIRFYLVSFPEIFLSSNLDYYPINYHFDILYHSHLDKAYFSSSDFISKEQHFQVSYSRRDDDDDDEEDS